MALSNTATPTYYGRFRASVMRGEIPVNEYVAMEMNRIDELIANPNFYYDAGAIDGFIAFSEGEMTLTDGEPLVMLESFKLWAESLLSWFYFVDRSVYVPNEDGHGGSFVQKRVKKRLRTKQYLIVARGAAKSMYAALLHAYFLIIDRRTTHQIATAPTMKQADEVLSPIRTAITRARGPLFDFLTQGSLQNTTGAKSGRQQLAATKKGIENFLTNSVLEIRPMSIAKLQGLRPKVATVDEWLSGDIREDVVGALEQGSDKGLNPNFIIVAISSEGTVRNGPGDSIKIELLKILRQETNAFNTSIWYYRLDAVEEVADPAMWPKANPNIGLTVSYETYALDVERAEIAPAVQNDILAKRFGIPKEGFSYFFTYEETIPKVIDPHRFWKMPCAMGADLSQGDDFCAFTFLFPLNDGSFGIVTRSYVSTLTMFRLPPAGRAKYEEFLEEGSLQVMEGTILDMNEVYDDVEEFIQASEFDVRAFGFDPYNAKEFVGRWERENGPFGIEKVIQGVRTESVPLGELKKLSEEGLLLFGQQLMKFAMGNAITLEDTNGNRKLMKKRHEQKIDNVSALLDAYVAYKANKEQFE